MTMTPRSQDPTLPLSGQITARTTLNDPRGNSGNKIERVELSDGRTLILKTVSRDWDWIARATNDDGRIVKLWDHGAFDRMPPSIDHTIVGVERENGSWRIFMRDAADALLRDEIRHDGPTARRILQAAADVHNVFWEADLPSLCSIEDRYRMLSPATARREKESGDARVADLIERSWAAFYENTPAKLGEIIRLLAEDSTPIANELRKCKQTLIHGDLRLGNAGFDGDRTILIDWGERVGMAPPAVELAWFIGFDAKRLDITRDEIVDTFRELYGDRFEERALQLALIGGLVHLGAHIGLGFVSADDDAKLAAAKEDCAWWTENVTRALEVWSPG